MSDVNRLYSIFYYKSCISFLIEMAINNFMGSLNANFCRLIPADFNEINFISLDFKKATNNH